MMRTNFGPAPSEHDEQAALFEWAEWMRERYPALRRLYAIPNGGKRDIVTAARLKAEGVKAGVPDICLPMPSGGYSALYIELKRSKGGRASDEQREWIDALNRLGNLAVVCHGWLHAAEVIQGYLRGGAA